MTTSTAPATGSGDARRPMRADARRNYDRLLEAGRVAFAERGGEASMEEIAKHADVGVGTLYRHFPRRIDLVEAVYRSDVDTLVAEADKLVDLEPWSALSGWLQAFIRYAQSKRVFLTELREAFEKNPELALDSRVRIGAAASSVLVRAQQAGAARTDIDAADLMHLIGGMCMARAATLEQNERLLGLVLDGIKIQP
ncbi:TetR/AcrR family transcriptional regulator [soil metagenome]|jgi:AcrR family transcriptional regulator